MADEIIITGREAASVVVDTSGIPAIVADFPVEQNLVADTVYVQGIPGSGGGDVASVAGRTGAVVLSSVDLTDSTATGRSLLTAADATDARTAIGAGTSNLTIGTTGTTAAAGNRQATATAIGMVELATITETTTGTDTTRAVTPEGLKAVADTKAPALGADDNYVTDAEKAKLANLSGVNTGDQDLSGYALLTSPGLLGRYVGVNAQVGTTYTPALSDEGKLVTLTNAAAITVTLPQDSDLAFPIGARTDYVVLGTGMATFVAGTGATVKVADTAVSRKTNSSMTAVKVAADTWLVVGDLA